MIFYVAEDFLCYFVSGGSVQRYEHGVGKREGHELFHGRIMFADKRHKILRFRAESESNGQFEKETDMEIAEVSLDSVEEQNVLFTPFE